MNEESLNANAGLCKFDSIIATPRWAAQLVLYNSTETKNAFLITLGHEFTHKEKDLFPFRLKVKNTLFVAYVNEFHADYNAAKRMFSSDKNSLLNSIEYKKKFKEDVLGEKDEDNSTHPSWGQKRIFVENFQFGADLIRQIAEYTGCKNKRLINKAIKFYDEIVLK